MRPATALANSGPVIELDYYDAQAHTYYQSTVGLDMSSIYPRFLNELSPGAHIADAGCGSGRDTKAFLQRGFVVTAFDASPRMSDLAGAYTGQKCHVLRFQEMQFRRKFDGIWACASLLHVPKTEIGGVLRRFVAALKPGGIVYASFVEEEGERIAADGRLYNSYTPESFRELLATITTIREITTWRTEERSSPAKRAPWLNFLLKKTTR